MIEKITYIAGAILFAETVIGLVLVNIYLSKVRERFPDLDPSVPFGPGNMDISKRTALGNLISQPFSPQLDHFLNKRYLSMNNPQLVQLGHVLRNLIIFHRFWFSMCVLLVLYLIVSV